MPFVSRALGVKFLHRGPIDQAVVTFWISNHARERMRRRRIDEDDVARLLSDPQETFERDDGCWEYLGMVRGRFLKVVLDEKKAPPALVTVHWLPRRA